jgi:L-iditol 2-dehydrogenase
MKAAIYNPKAKESAYLSIAEIDKPKLSNNNAIIKVTGVGVCGSDLLKLNRSLVKPGTILGHEMVGIIDEISGEMSSKYNLKKGDRIVSSHHVPCLACKYCLNGKESLCTQFKSSNFNPGAFCEYLELSELHLKHTVQKISDHLSDIEASFTEPLACCIKAIERSGLRNYVIASDFNPSLQGAIATKQTPCKVLIIGLGSIGLMIGQLVKHYSPDSDLTGLDLLEDRLEFASQLGFDNALSSLRALAKQSPSVDEIASSPSAPCNDDTLFDIIFLCAGANSSIDLAIEAAANGATIVIFSSVGDENKAFTNNQIYYKELTILGSYSPNLNNLKESLELISAGKILVKELITHESNLEDLGISIQKLNEEKGIKLFLKANN